MSDHLLCRFDGLGSILYYKCKSNIHVQQLQDQVLCKLFLKMFKKDLWAIYQCIIHVEQVIHVYEMNRQICKNKET